MVFLLSDDGAAVVARRQRDLDYHALAVLRAARAGDSGTDRRGHGVATVPFNIAALLGPRDAIVGLVFLALALWALKYPAPLGPSVTEADRRLSASTGRAVSVVVPVVEIYAGRTRIDRGRGPAGDRACV